MTLRAARACCDVWLVEPVMLVELRVAEQRLRAVWEVLDGASVTDVARRFGASAPGR